jgi:hypothetical protein
MTSSRQRVTKTFGPLCLLATLSACVGTIPAGAGDEGTPPDTGGGGGVTPPKSGGSGPKGPGMEIPPPKNRPPVAAVATTRFARLSHRQWENTVRDLLRLPAIPGLSARFSTDATGTFTSGDALSVSDNLRSDYQTAAEVLAQKVAQDPAALARILPPGLPATGKDRAAGFIRDFGRRAYRRPLDDQENQSLAALFAQGPTLIPGVDPFAAGVQLVVEAMLQSPHFLYRTELGTGTGRQRLGDHEIAAKLSYALAGTMPDDDLFTAAGAGALKTDEQVAAQAERLLGKSGDSAVTFHEELFRLDGITSDLDKDAARFPEFKPAWRDSIRKESNLFLGEIFARGQGLAELLTAPYTFVDATLAALYGVSAPPGGNFARVDLDPKQRAGFLTQIGFLARSGETESDPILRGAFINQRLLCLEMEPPPGATASIAEPPASAKTNRARVTAITSPATCAGCHHTLINPAGFAFENYDALGRYRTAEGGQPVDAADSYNFASGAKSFANGVEFSRLLAESTEVHQC